MFKRKKEEEKPKTEDIPDTPAKGPDEQLAGEQAEAGQNKDSEAPFAKNDSKMADRQKTDDQRANVDSNGTAFEETHEADTPGTFIEAQLAEERSTINANGKIAVKKEGARPAEVLMVAIAFAVLASLVLVFVALYMLAQGIGALFVSSGTRANPPAGTYAIISVEGTIQTGNSSGYQHKATMDFISKITEDDGNEGILLYMNTGGGGVYESDEMYRALMHYKEETGRPVWAYMAKSCASGGYYICAAADYIIANYNTTTGSIGVYYQFTDTSGLYEKIGVETVLVRSGSNKGIGVDGTEFTSEHQAIYQSMVDESYETFITLVAEGREMHIDTVRALSDGRPYTARQALDAGLVDELNDWDGAKEAFDEFTGTTGYSTGFSGSSPISRLLGDIGTVSPKSDTQALLEFADSMPGGLLMASMEGLGY